MKRMLLISFFFILTVVIAVVITIYLTDTSGTPESYDVYKIPSAILNEERTAIVKTPVGYEEANQDYPVVYVCGGNSLTFSVASDLEVLNRTGYTQPIIVVGLPNISQKTRQRDLTPPFMKQDLDEANSPLGAAHHYLNFIESEVFPLIDEHYRTSSKRIIVGHSREGLMVMYSLIKNPNMFNGYLALSPALWRENSIFLQELVNFLEKDQEIDAQLFLSMGEAEVDKMKNAFDSAVNILKKDTTSLEWKSMYIPKANHASNPYLSAPLGLDWILKK